MSWLSKFKLKKLKPPAEVIEAAEHLIPLPYVAVVEAAIEIAKDPQSISKLAALVNALKAIGVKL